MFLQCDPSESGAVWQSGYFLQFGGFNNTRNRLIRAGSVVDESRAPLIEPDRLHHIVAECDGESVRLVVDGKLVLVCADAQPLVGPERDSFGFYMWTGARIERVEVYTK